MRFGLFVSCVGSMVLAVVLGGCPSDAEKPNAYALSTHVPGTLGEPCRSNGTCVSDDLICVSDPSNTDGSICRNVCDPTAQDPCGVDFVCVEVQTTTVGACVPAVGLNEECGRCDDGLICITFGDEAEGEGESEGEGEGEGDSESVCKTRCLRDGSDGGCGTLTCSSYGDDTFGYCGSS